MLISVSCVKHLYSSAMSSKKNKCRKVDVNARRVMLEGVSEKHTNLPPSDSDHISHKYYKRHIIVHHKSSIKISVSYYSIKSFMRHLAGKVVLWQTICRIYPIGDCLLCDLL